MSIFSAIATDVAVPDFGTVKMAPDRITQFQENVVAEAVPYKQWQCELCSFLYDEAVGIPEEGIAPGTRWEDVLADWTCPDCSAGKADFQMIEF